MSQKIVIYGPTCSGKSCLAELIAEHLDAVIINADSMQIYKEIPILSANQVNIQKIINYLHI